MQEESHLPTDAPHPVSESVFLQEHLVRDVGAPSRTLRSRRWEVVFLQEHFHVYLKSGLESAFGFIRAEKTACRLLQEHFGSTPQGPEAA